MNDRELLEMAGKAYKPVCADGSYLFYWNSNWDCMVYVTGDLDEYGGTFQIQWDPLSDDGDALRLASKLNLSVCYTLGEIAPPYGTVMVGYSPWESKTPLAHERYGSPDEVSGTEIEKLKATRRAIVRAAAEIGKAMP